jgi:AcrR family transcriptional regulator
MVARMKQDPRWGKTREALLAGGRRIMARKGVDAASVLEIVKAAGVSQPSFYNHFASKEELAQAIAAQFFQADAGFKSRVFQTAEDPAEAIAINVRHTLKVATHDPVVAWVVVRGGSGRDLLRIGEPDQLVNMIRTGTGKGRFRALDARVVAEVIRAAAFPLLQDILEGTAPDNIDIQFAELVLLMLGIPAQEAAEIAARPDPPWTEEFEPARK